MNIYDMPVDQWPENYYLGFNDGETWIQGERLADRVNHSTVIDLAKQIASGVKFESMEEILDVLRYVDINALADEWKLIGELGSDAEYIAGWCDAIRRRIEDEDDALHFLIMEPKQQYGWGFKAGRDWANDHGWNEAPPRMLKCEYSKGFLDAVSDVR